MIANQTEISVLVRLQFDIELNISADFTKPGVAAGISVLGAKMPPGLPHLKSRQARNGKDASR